MQTTEGKLGVEDQINHGRRFDFAYYYLRFSVKPPAVEIVSLAICDKNARALEMADNRRKTCIEPW